MINREPSKTPGLPEVLLTAVSSVLEGAYYCGPGRIEKYDDSLQKASVKPLLMRTTTYDDGTKKSFELPVIGNVPVIFPRGGGFYFSLPLEKGDNVLLVFCDRSIDKFKSSSGDKPIDPVDLRTNDITDAVAIAGFYPFLKPLKDGTANKGKLALGYDGGAHIKISKTQVDINGNFTVDL